MSDDKAVDILGIKPIGDAINTTVSKTFEGIEAFLGLTCKPALEELGLMVKDQIRVWRLNNIYKILEKAKGKLAYEAGNVELKAHPRVGLSIIENGSLVDDDELQEMWAGMFASSCTETGNDDQNLIFVNLLRQLTTLQVKILKHICENARKIIYPSGLILADSFRMTFKELAICTQITDLERLDRELDHLASLELIRGELWANGGFEADGGADNELEATVTPTTIALNLYLKCNGQVKSLKEYWSKDLIPVTIIEKEQEEIRKEEMEKQKKEFEIKRQKQVEKYKQKKEQQ